MAKNIFSLLLLVLFLSTEGHTYENKGIRMAASEPIPAGSIGIKQIINNGYLEMVVLDAAGNQEPLTLGNFISYSVNAILGKSVDYCTLTKTQPIYVGYEIKHAALHSFITTAAGEKSPFTIPSFVQTLSDTLLNCKPYDDSRPQPKNTSPILFEKKMGKLVTMIADTKGNLIPLNLGNLLSISSQVFPDCTPSKNQDRMVQILIDDSDLNNLKLYQIDAYGKKENFSLDNLASAVVETLMNCAQDVSNTLAAPEPRSLKIKFVTTSDGDIQTYIVTKGDTVELNLGTLLAAASEMVPYYHGKTDHLLITYTRDSSGNIKGTLTDLMGNMMELNIHNLVKASALFYGY